MPERKHVTDGTACWCNTAVQHIAAKRPALVAPDPGPAPAPWDDPAGCFGHCDREGWFAPCTKPNDLYPITADENDDPLQDAGDR